MRRKQFFVAAPLLVVTIVIYIIVLFQSIRAYETWKQTMLEETPQGLRQYLDFDPYIISLHGEQMILAGALITLGWLTVVIILSKGKLRYH